MARKSDSIIYDSSASDIPLYPCGMSNGVWVSGIRKKWWLIKIKHDEDVNAFFVKESDLQKLYDKNLLN